MEAINAVGSHIDHIALFRESLAKIVRELGFVFNDQQLHAQRSRRGLSQPVQIVICTFYPRSVPVLTLSPWLRAYRLSVLSNGKDHEMKLTHLVCLEGDHPGYGTPPTAQASSMWHPAPTEEGFTYHPDHFQSTKTRAQVMAEVEAAPDGTLAILQRGAPLPIKSSSAEDAPAGCR